MTERFEPQTIPPIPKTRAQHLKWCRNRALFYLDDGKLLMAIAAMADGLDLHDETRHHPALAGAKTMVEFAALPPERWRIRDWINGFG